MDYHIMQFIGTQQNDATLLAAATAQHERFSEKSLSDYDVQVGIFDDLFDKYDGFNGLQRVFKLIKADGISWHDVAPNPSPLLSEYVIAYLQVGLGATSDLTQSSFIANNVGKADTSITPYSVDANVVGDIADAHCSIAAASADSTVAQSSIKSALDSLRKGDYANASIASKKCAQNSDCPHECSCATTTTQQCVARWRAK
jgi:hypothetical protein